VWAFVSKDVDKRLRANFDKPFIELSAKEWRSGDIPWIVAAGGLPDALRATLGHMAQNVFPGRPANIVVIEDGKALVRQLVPPAAQDNEKTES